MSDKGISYAVGKKAIDIVRGYKGRRAGRKAEAFEREALQRTDAGELNTPEGQIKAQELFEKAARYRAQEGTLYGAKVAAQDYRYAASIAQMLKENPKVSHSHKPSEKHIRKLSINAHSLESMVQQLMRGITGRFAIATSILTLSLSLIFSTSVITGNAIAENTLINANYLGLVLFVIGILSSFIFFKLKRQ